MTRPWTMLKMADHVVGLLGTEPDRVDGGELTFVAGPLQSVLLIWKDKYDRDRFGWSVCTYDAALKERMMKFGGMSVHIQHRQPGTPGPGNIPPPADYTWPSGKDPLPAEASRSFSHFGIPSLTFVRDRHDLGMLLLASDHVARGEVWARAPRASEPARLALAIVLARHAADRDLEKAALTKLRAISERLFPFPQPDILFRQSVADWAKSCAKASGIDLSDLIKLKSRPMPDA